MGGESSKLSGDSTIPPPASGKPSNVVATTSALGRAGPGIRSNVAACAPEPHAIIDAMPPVCDDRIAKRGVKRSPAIADLTSYETKSADAAFDILEALRSEVRRGIPHPLIYGGRGRRRVSIPS